MYSYQLDVMLQLPPCDGNPVIYMCDAYGSDLDIQYSGDDCASGVFTPQAKTEYTIKMWYQRDRYRAHVIALRV